VHAVTRTIEQTLDEIERFFERAAEVEGIATSAATRLAPTSDDAIDALAKKFDLTIPDDVRRFWRRGLNYKELSLRGDKPAFAGFDWYNLEYLARLRALIGAPRPPGPPKSQALPEERDPRQGRLFAD